jgi:hypothetical protein
MTMSTNIGMEFSALFHVKFLRAFSPTSISNTTFYFERDPFFCECRISYSFCKIMKC